jgi:ABC-type transporter Mla subunit MlaD
MISAIESIGRSALNTFFSLRQTLTFTAQITENLTDPNGDVRRILRNAETVTSRFSKKESILEMAVGNPESIKSIHESLGKLRDITVRADSIPAQEQ